MTGIEEKQICHNSLNSTTPYYCYNGYPSRGDVKGRFRCMLWDVERCRDIL